MKQCRTLHLAKDEEGGGTTKRARERRPLCPSETRERVLGGGELVRPRTVSDSPDSHVTGLEETELGVARQLVIP